MSSIRLTQYSHGAGCGCKIAPDVLDGISPRLGQRRVIGSSLSAIKGVKTQRYTTWAMAAA